MDKPKIRMNRRMIGQSAATPALLADIGMDGVAQLMARHESGDWGEISDDSYRQNKANIEGNEQYDMVLSIYTVNGEKVWIKTYLYYNTVACYASED